MNTLEVTNAYDNSCNGNSLYFGNDPPVFSMFYQSFLYYFLILSGGDNGSLLTQVVLCYSSVLNIDINPNRY